jgi:hypothetical protein
MCSGKKNKKHWVGLSVGFLVLLIFRISFLSQWFTFQFSMSLSCFLHLAVTGGGMVSKGLRAISCQVTAKFGAGYYAPNTSETLINYTACVRPA